MNVRRQMAQFFAALALLLPAVASAAPRATASMEVSAVVVPNCTLTISPLIFGNYDPLGAHAAAPLDATTEMRVICTRDTHASILMDNGRNAAVGAPQRLLAEGGQHLGYQLFRDSARTQIWGRGAEALAYVSPVSTSVQALTIFARIPPGQEVAAGVYTDVVTATVDF